MAKRGVLSGIKQQAARLGARAMQELASNEKASQRVMDAMRVVQQGRRAIDERSARMIGALGLATHADLERVSRKVGRLRKRLQSLLDELSQREG